MKTVPPKGSLQVPSGLIIPSIDVVSQVEQLSILNLGDSRAYETPKSVVGHIPQTANPGEAGTSWLFGHLESPIRGDGNVFSQLTKIPSLLRRGEDVYAIVETGTMAYLYRIIETEVVPQEELRLFDTGRASLVMVTCVPRLIYDHRLVISAELIGVRS
jgi:LPXTG-site transpeptidase (sortase) family protein